MIIGKTALVLGGGGSKGAYEIGVWQALNELGINIDIVTGTSIGAVNGALVAQNDFEKAKEIWSKMEEGTVTEFTEKNRLKEMLYANLDENKIRNSVTKYGIVTVEFPSFKSHCVFVDEIQSGKLIDYILASAACFPIIDPHEIDNKKFIDGAYFDNVPAKMAIDAGAQTIIAVDLDAIGIVKKEAFKQAESLVLITPNWDLGSFFVFNRENTKRIIRLGYLDTMKAFGVFNGRKYTFIKGEFAKRGLVEADAVADVLELDPTIIYSKEILDIKIIEALIAERQKPWKEELKNKLKQLIEKKPKELLAEEILAKRYLEKNKIKETVQQKSETVENILKKK